jgi:hypothetical protein
LLSPSSRLVLIQAKSQPPMRIRHSEKSFPSRGPKFVNFLPLQLRLWSSVLRKQILACRNCFESWGQWRVSMAYNLICIYKYIYTVYIILCFAYQTLTGLQYRFIRLHTTSYHSPLTCPCPPGKRQFSLQNQCTDHLHLKVVVCSMLWPFKCPLGQKTQTGTNVNSVQTKADAHPWWLTIPCFTWSVHWYWAYWASWLGPPGH